jgi:hypothetical protein
VRAVDPEAPQPEAAARALALLRPLLSLRAAAEGLRADDSVSGSGEEVTGAFALGSASSGDAAAAGSSLGEGGGGGGERGEGGPSPRAVGGEDGASDDGPPALFFPLPPVALPPPSIRNGRLTRHGIAAAAAAVRAFGPWALLSTPTDAAAPASPSIFQAPILADNAAGRILALADAWAQRTSSSRSGGGGVGGEVEVAGRFGLASSMLALAASAPRLHAPHRDVESAARALLVGQAAAAAVCEAERAGALMPRVARRAGASAPPAALSLAVLLHAIDAAAARAGTPPVLTLANWRHGERGTSSRVGGGAAGQSAAAAAASAGAPAAGTATSAFAAASRPFSPEEDQLLALGLLRFGSRSAPSIVAALLPARSEEAVARRLRNTLYRARRGGAPGGRRGGGGGSTSTDEEEGGGGGGGGGEEEGEEGGAAPRRRGRRAGAGGSDAAEGGGSGAEDGEGGAGFPASPFARLGSRGSTALLAEADDVITRLAVDFDAAERRLLADAVLCRGLSAWRTLSATLFPHRGPELLEAL